MRAANFTDTLRMPSSTDCFFTNNKMLIIDEFQTPYVEADTTSVVDLR
jgi:hypothetical protein